MSGHRCSILSLLWKEVFSPTFPSVAYFFIVSHTKEITDQVSMMAKPGRDSAFKAVNKAIAEEADKNTPERRGGGHPALMLLQP